MDLFSYTNLINFIIGILSGITSAEIYHYYTIHRSIRKERQFLKAFEGWWIEIIEYQEDRKFSFAKFRYDKATNSHQYLGENFYKDGTRYYKWESVRLFREAKDKEILYIYKTTQDGSISKRGFGVMKYSPDEKTFLDGYFVDAAESSSFIVQSKQRPLKIYRIEKIAKEIYFDLGNFSSKRLGAFTKALYEWEEKHKKHIIDLVD